MNDLAEKILLGTIAILAPIHAAILAVGFLIAVDLITGIMASRKRKEVFSSARLKNTATKLLVYNLLLISGFVAETYLSNWIPFKHICLGFLASVEIASIGENFQDITGLKFLKYLRKSIDKKLNVPKED